MDCTVQNTRRTNTEGVEVCLRHRRPNCAPNLQLPTKRNEAIASALRQRATARRATLRAIESRAQRRAARVKWGRERGERNGDYRERARRTRANGVNEYKGPREINNSAEEIRRTRGITPRIGLKGRYFTSLRHLRVGDSRRSSWVPEFAATQRYE